MAVEDQSEADAELGEIESRRICHVLLSWPSADRWSMSIRPGMAYESNGDMGNFNDWEEMMWENRALYQPFRPVSTPRRIALLRGRFSGTFSATVRFNLTANTERKVNRFWNSSGQRGGSEATA